jgi:hypothetical protein
MCQSQNSVNSTANTTANTSVSLMNRDKQAGSTFHVSFVCIGIMPDLLQAAYTLSAVAAGLQPLLT